MCRRQQQTPSQPANTLPPQQPQPRPRQQPIAAKVSNVYEMSPSAKQNNEIYVTIDADKFKNQDENGIYLTFDVDKLKPNQRLDSATMA